ncbi:MAG: L-threonine 3-dehydrogenase [Candidatus Aminicenantes bacterium]|nr:L-threonine 3-dehydrogenase [Candidatus Aminicenantes bacterium]
MPEKMVAVRKMQPGRGFDVVEVPLPELERDQVLVGVEAASICGTDLHIWNWDDWSAQRIRPPLTLGHEFSGTVVDVGKAVSRVRVGDYVSAESHITCGMCFQCRTGQAHMCPSTRILGIAMDGAFAEYVAVPEKVIWQNDRSKLSPEVASLQEPFGNAVFATNAHDLSGQSVAILGCGAIGLFSVGIARASGAARILGVDLNDYRLGLARKMGAHQVLNATGAGGAQGIADWLVRNNDGLGVDIVLEMSGAPSAIDAAFRGVRNGGRVTLFGIPSNPVQIDVAEQMIFKNLTVLALHGRRIFDTWYRTRWLLESGVVDLTPLITRQLGLEDIHQAMELLASGEACKIILRPGADYSHYSGASVQETSGTTAARGAIHL